MKVLITGSLGLLGSECSKLCLDFGWSVIGIDNNMRAHFFGPSGSVMGNMISHPKYTHYEMDILSASGIIMTHKPDAVIHCAAQPSHDWAAKDPCLDFHINAYGTLMLLDACRKFCPDVVFIYVSTNKVYGDRPNQFPMKELDTRYEIDWPIYEAGFTEDLNIDQCMHSLFGVSKLSGDLLAQEYAKYFGMKTGIFRCGCITGKQHAGVELHGFLSYLVRCKKEKIPYTIYGYKGKQVRDNIHASDLAKAFAYFIHEPHPGEVYNMGGSRYSNISVLEAIGRLGIDYEYCDQARKGDHIWYISDVHKFAEHYPLWGYEYDMEKILEDLVSS